MLRATGSRPLSREGPPVRRGQQVRVRQQRRRQQQFQEAQEEEVVVVKQALCRHSMVQCVGVCGQAGIVQTFNGTVGVCGVGVHWCLGVSVCVVIVQTFNGTCTVGVWVCLRTLLWTPEMRPLLSVKPALSLTCVT